MSKTRLDQMVAQRQNISRNQASTLIKDGFVSVDGKSETKPSLLVAPDQLLEVEQKAKADQEDMTIDFEIKILYEDEYLLVVEKPAGVVVHRAESYKKATLVDFLESKNIPLSDLGGADRKGIVHRIDKETSGLLIIAKDNTTRSLLSDQLKSQQIGRYYLAVIDQRLKSDLVVEKPLDRSGKNRKKIIVKDGGKEAKTAFVSLLDIGDQQLISAKLFSGRTHQIRAHLAHLNRHIIYDQTYGYKGERAIIDQIFLHAFCLEFVHPHTSKTISITSKLDSNILQYLYTFYTKEEIDETLEKAFIFDRFNDLLGVSNTA